MNMKYLVSSLKVIILGIVLASGVSYIFAWTVPTSTPPDGDVSAPINVGSNTQTKSGNIILSQLFADGITVFGASTFNGNLTIGSTSAVATVKIVDGNQAPGKVLTSDINGKASWQTPSTTASGTVGGGCFAIYALATSTPYVPWGNAQSCATAAFTDGTGNTNHYITSMTCPSGYHSQVISANWSSNGGGGLRPEEELCLSN